MTSKEQNHNSDLRGIKSSNTTSDLFTPYSDMTVDLMMTSFWLPTDVITNQEWTVMPVKVITGKEFHRFMASSRAGGFANIHCDVDEDLVAAAHYVGISIRYNKKERATCFLIAKVWYGVPKKLDTMKLDDGEAA